MPELIVALDYPDQDQALDMAGLLQGTVSWFKVGLELFTTSGPRVIGRLKGLGASVFLDLKFLDIPNTVRGAVLSGARAGADLMTIHILGGRNMIQAALDGRDQCSSRSEPPLLFGVTLLTSMNARDLPIGEDLGDQDLVLMLAETGYSSGLDGVVCSGLEVQAVKNRCSSDFYCLTPGIRKGRATDDQKRVVTPEMAVRAGSDFLVVGRPITGASNPAAEARAFLEAMSS